MRDMKLDGYRFQNNAYTLGPEALRGAYKRIRTDAVVGLSHSLVLMPPEWRTNSLLSSLMFLPPVHLTAPSVPNCFNEMQTYLYLHDKFISRPHVAVHIYLHKEPHLLDNLNKKMYNTHAALGLGMYY